MVLTQRNISLLACLVAFGLVIFGFYCEYVVGCRPCLLCVIQRNTFIAIAILFFVAFLHQQARGPVRGYGALTALLAIIGMIAAGRQLWMQHIPGEPKEMCVPGLGYLFREFPFFEALQMIITGSQDCGRIDWQFLHISMAGWAMVFFVLFFSASVAIMKIRR